MDTKKLFKVFLDSALFNSSELEKFSSQRPENPMEVANWAYCFLRSLIGHAMNHIGNALHQKIENAAIKMQLLIHCILSTPTTWDANTITTFGFIAERAIHDAKHSQTYAVSVKTIKVNVTEPDAVANYILHEGLTPLHHGHIFLVLDVGGATSDSYCCQVAEVYGHRICVVLDRKAPIQGITHGCVDVDRTFQLRVMERLNLARISNFFSVAMQMRYSQEFQDCKTYYQRGMHNMGFRIPRIGKATTIQHLQIIQGRMML